MQYDGLVQIWATHARKLWQWMAGLPGSLVVELAQQSLLSDPGDCDSLGKHTSVRGKWYGNAFG